MIEYMMIQSLSSVETREKMNVIHHTRTERPASADPSDSRYREPPAETAINALKASSVSANQDVTEHAITTTHSAINLRFEQIKAQV